MSALTVRLPDDKHLRLKALARDRGTSVNRLIEDMTTDTRGIPSALLHNLKHNKVLHERVIILNVRFMDEPFAMVEDRLKVTKIAENVFLVVLSYGFMDNINVPESLADPRLGMQLEMMDTTFFFSRENLIPARGSGMMAWREHLFATMSRGAASPMTFFRIPPNRVVELGTQLEI